MLFNVLISESSDDISDAKNIFVEVENLESTIFVNFVQDVLASSGQAVQSSEKPLVYVYREMERNNKIQVNLLSTMSDYNLSPDHLIEIQTNKSQDNMPTKRESSDNMLHLDNEDVQKRIYEEIQAENIKRSLESAHETMPESFIPAHLLFIKCEVKGYTFPALVDTGAQSTIMSKEFVDKVGIGHMVDKNFKGMAQGVGTQEIYGRIHLLKVMIDNFEIDMGFSVMSMPNLSVLIGLNMLQKYSAQIDLKNYTLKIDHATLPFLPENKVEAFKVGVESKVIKDVEPLVEQGFSLKESIKAYEMNDRNIDKACAYLISKE